MISLHTPLDASTRHLFDTTRLAALKPGTWLINASRGAVVDNAALRSLLPQRPDLKVVLDVWEGEPQADVELAALCQLATPHIAGYSLDGKLRGTAQIYQACCRALGVAEQVSLADLLPAPWLSELSIDGSAGRPGPWPASAARYTTRAAMMPTFAAAWLAMPIPVAPASTDCASTTPCAAKSMAYAYVFRAIQRRWPLWYEPWAPPFRRVG